VAADKNSDKMHLFLNGATGISVWPEDMVQRRLLIGIKTALQFICHRTAGGKIRSGFPI
jgi:hypothetical protein